MSALAKKIIELDLAYPGHHEASFDVPPEVWAELVTLAHAEAPDFKPYRWAILACSKSKLDRPAPAVALYTGELFKASLAVANKYAERTLILSAKHGVLPVDRIVEPYEQALPTDKHQRAVWGDNVARELNRAFGVKDRANIKECEAIGEGVLCLAPESYVGAIGFMYGPRTWTRPLKGLGIGQQKAELKRMLGEVTP